ncbi:unnamed protein product, partial [Mesorhabditis spiculigera]
MSDLHGVEQRVLNVENVIKHVLTQTANGLDDRYEKYIPLLNRQRLDLAEGLQALDKEISRKLEDIAIRVTAAEETGAKLETVRMRIEAIREARGFVEAVEDVERHLAKAYFVEPPISTMAQNVRHLTQSLDSVSKCAEKYGIEKRIGDSLGAEVRRQYEYLCYQLTKYYKEAIQFGDPDVKNTHILTFNMPTVTTASQHFTAMADIKSLDVRLVRLAEYIVDKMCAAVIKNGGAPAAVKIYRDTMDKLTIKVRVPAKTDKSEPLDAKAVLSALTILLRAIAEQLNLVVVQQRSLSLCLGKHIEKPLMQLLLKEVISVCVPALAHNDDPTMQAVMEAAEAWRDALIEAQLFTVATPTFASFAAENDRVFIDRR